MMKYIVTMLGVALISSSVMAGTVTNTAKWNVPWGDAWRSRAEETLDAYETEINSSGTTPSLSTLAVSGKSTLSGELEVNNSDVDINLTLKANYVRIDQTNAVGTTTEPLIEVTDARTGTTADSAAEASLVITAAGAYGLSVADGIVNIEGEIDSTGDITIDPDGDDLIVDGTIDATAITTDAASGIDVKSAGALDIGNTTATSIDYGSSAVTAHTFTSDGTGDTEFVVPDESISATEMVTAVQTSLGLADSALQNADVWGAPGLTVTTNSTSEVEVAIQTKTIAGGDLAERRFIRVYAATTEGGVASAADTTSFVLSTGTAVETFLADADYSYVTAVAGTALLTVTSSGASTKWITVIDGSSTTETRTDFTGP